MYSKIRLFHNFAERIVGNSGILWGMVWCFKRPCDLWKVLYRMCVVLLGVRVYFWHDGPVLLSVEWGLNLGHWWASLTSILGELRHRFIIRKVADYWHSTADYSDISLTEWKLCWDLPQYSFLLVGQLKVTRNVIKYLGRTMCWFHQIIRRAIICLALCSYHSVFRIHTEEVILVSVSCATVRSFSGAASQLFPCQTHPCLHRVPRSEDRLWRATFFQQMAHESKFLAMCDYFHFFYNPTHTDFMQAFRNTLTMQNGSGKQLYYSSKRNPSLWKG